MINNDDLMAFYNRKSDLAFELDIYNQIRKKFPNTIHSGKYLDPASDKIREFDILIKMENTLIVDEKFGKFIPSFDEIGIAIECKNISINHPIIVGCRNSHYEYIGYLNVDLQHGKISRIYNSNFELTILSNKEKFIGVEIQQYHSDATKNFANEKGSPYDKWSQAINHSIYRYPLLLKNSIIRNSKGNVKVLCMPVMVVPEDTLYLMKNFDMEKQIIMKSNIVLMKAGNEFMINNNQCEIPTYIIATKQGLLEFLNIFSRISN
ncbi:MAG: hypothetical protein IM319_05820 [Microcystis sp. M113S1]|jgi:hypothetical protein|uniref:hypothetical protein n=1 Tax=Microcystis sp. M113S1 TaxID=2771104 RepID=UPI002587D180|nr:hypothetical protein [Microcystis sp. M113S1]MCA2938700.1 hypothetical protein [Microcystis sp. M113S1]